MGLILHNILYLNNRLYTTGILSIRSKTPNNQSINVFEHFTGDSNSQSEVNFLVHFRKSIHAKKCTPRLNSNYFILKIKRNETKPTAILSLFQIFKISFIPLNLVVLKGTSYNACLHTCISIYLTKIYTNTMSNEVKLRVIAL